MQARQIIDFQGEVVADCLNAAESVITGEVDLEALRRCRSNPSRVPPVTSRCATYALRGLAARLLPRRPEIAGVALERLYERGVLVRPTGALGPEPEVLLRD